MKTKKIISIIAYILISILAIAVVPASVFLTEFPKYTTIVLCVSLVVSCVCCFRVAVNRKAVRILMAVMTLFVMVITVLGNYCNPYWNSIYYKNSGFCKLSMDTALTREEAMEDLEFVMAHLKKVHPMFYNNVPEEVMERYEAVKSELQEMESITVCELNRKIEPILSVMGDGHSFVKANMEEYHYMKDIEQFRRKNYDLVAINGMEMKDLLEQTRDLYSYEVESWQLVRLKGDITSAEGLQYIGFSVEDGVTFTYEAEDGTREDHTYYTEDFITYEEYVEYNQIEQNTSEDVSFVSYEIDAENDIVVLTLDSCVYDEEYRNCVKEMFEQVKAQGIGNVAVDLRNNGGGSSLVANEFFRYLDVETWKAGSFEWRFGCFIIPSGEWTVENDKYSDLTFAGDLYLLTSADSFSSAMLFAQYVKDNHMGTIIGEAPGNTPNGYGDIACFQLPNSQLFMQLSTKEFFRVDRDNPVNLVEPDITCDSEVAAEVLYENIR